MIGQTIGHYKILEKLGAGGMGEVYAATDLELERRVALKVLPKEMADNQERLTRFRREAKTLASLSHPSIVTIYSVEHADGVHFLTMELLRGHTLRELIPGGGVDVEKFFEIAIPLADALAAAHDQEVIHRDLKPSNVFVTETDTIKVLDFGLAKIQSSEVQDVDTRGPTEVLTGEGRVLGTVPYMSPEQLKGQKIDERSDIFSFGIVLYQLATGDLPFNGSSSVEVQSSILRDTPTSVDELRREMPHHVGRIVAACLEKDPEQRYQSVKDIRNELVRLRDEVTTGEREATPTSKPRKRTGLARPGWWVGAVLLAVGVLGAVLWLLTRNGPDPPPTAIESSQVGEAAQELLDQGHLFELRGDLRENLEEAEERYRRALQLEPENPYIKARLAALLARIQIQYPEEERITEIRQLAQSALDSGLQMPDAWIALGQLSLLEGDGQAAEQAAEELLAADPEDYRGYTLRGEALLLQDRIDEGLFQLREGVKLAGTDMRARLTLARSLRHLGRANDAAAEYEAILRYSPDLPNALSNLGMIYAMQGRYLDAVPMFKRLVQLHKDEIAALNLANCYVAMGRYDEAIETYKISLEIAPDQPFTAHALAEAYVQAEDTEAARQWYEKAVEAYDASLAAGASRAQHLGWRAGCLAMLGRYEEAEADVNELLEIAPDRSSPLFNAAQVYALAGDRRQAFDYLQRAVEAGYPRQQVESDLAFKAFREDPEFRALIEAPVVP
jgi:serine/threonine protein kinase/cytochrome c-type biogenesis protein CcmH/NrfG